MMMWTVDALWIILWGGGIGKVSQYDFYDGSVSWDSCSLIWIDVDDGCCEMLWITLD